jgi:hypothetical protein
MDGRFSLVILDIDHFKKVNDAHGHHIGDEVLRWLSRLVMAQARETDFVARYGGKNLWSSCPPPGVTDAFRFTQRLVKTMGGHSVSMGPKKHQSDAFRGGGRAHPRCAQRRGNDSPVGRSAVRRQKRRTQPCSGLCGLTAVWPMRSFLGHCPRVVGVPLFQTGALFVGWSCYVCGSGSVHSFSTRPVPGRIWSFIWGRIRLALLVPVFLFCAPRKPCPGNSADATAGSDEQKPNCWRFMRPRFTGKKRTP